MGLVVGSAASGSRLTQTDTDASFDHLWLKLGIWSVFRLQARSGSSDDDDDDMPDDMPDGWPAVRLETL